MRECDGFIGVLVWLSGRKRGWGELQSCHGGDDIAGGAYSHTSITVVMAGLVPAIPIIQPRCPANRDHRDKPGDDN